MSPARGRATDSIRGIPGRGQGSGGIEEAGGRARAMKTVKANGDHSMHNVQRFGNSARRGWFAVVGLALFLMPAAALAQEPPPIGDRPTIAVHLDQAAIGRGAVGLDELMAHGSMLFLARFNTLDGQGRPASTGTGAPRVPVEPAFIRTSGPTSNSCAGCHIIPRVGGAGDFVANTFLQAEALDPVARFVLPEFANERNTLGMHGSGPIEMLARELTRELIAIRETAREAALIRARAGESPLDVEETRALVAKGIRFGEITVRGDGKVNPSRIEGVDWDLIVKPFRHKGTSVSLREISDYSLNHHHGMQSSERFGLGADPDGDGVTDEITVGDLTALAVYQASLGTPGQRIPADPAAARAAETGRERFGQIGCAACHIAELTLDDRRFQEPNPLNPPGQLSPAKAGGGFAFDMTREGEKPRLEPVGTSGAIVRAFTDLKRHDLNDADFDHFANERLADGTLFGFASPEEFYRVPERVGRSTREFLTRKLWDVGSSDPYGHRGDLPMITEAIHVHGGEARASRDAFFALPKAERNEIVEFLKTLQVLPPGSPPRLQARAG